MAKPPPQLALPEIDLEEKVVEVKVRLKGPAAVELADYQRAYKALKGKPVELEPMVAGMLHTFIEADRGFQAWRKADASPKPETGGKADGG
jgi:hypothetical protein